MLNYTSMIRRVDDLGRIVIPKEVRRDFNIREGDPLEIVTDKESGIVGFKLYKEPDHTEKLNKLATAYVEKNKDIIDSVLYHDDDTLVKFKNKKVVSVSRHCSDKFNLNVALCHAMAQAGFKDGNPICDGT
jgi:AbrB family transcriptional regulator (stage V sporulation protein T)